MTCAESNLMDIVRDEIVPFGRYWTGIVPSGAVLRLVDLEGQQAVDFLCFDAADPHDRYSLTNTIKVQGRVYITTGTTLYADSGAELMTVVGSSLATHDTIYGCCSAANNRLRYGASGDGNCYDNLLAGLQLHGLDRLSIVGNINFFMQVPVATDGSAGIAAEVSAPGSFVELRAERDTLVVFSNCPQMLNPCNGYRPSPVRAVIGRP